MKLFWKYSDMQDFEETRGTVLKFPESDEWATVPFDLSTLESWDSNRNIVKMKLAIIEPDAQNNSISDKVPNLYASDNSPLEINYVIFDRKAFADTFVR